MVMGRNLFMVLCPPRPLTNLLFNLYHYCGIFSITYLTHKLKHLTLNLGEADLTEGNPSSSRRGTLKSYEFKSVHSFSPLRRGAGGEGR